MAIAPVITVNNFMYWTKHMKKLIIKNAEKNTLKQQ